MLLQTSISSPPLRHYPLPSTSSETLQFPSCSITLRIHRSQTNSITKAYYNNNSVDVQQERPSSKWRPLFDRVSNSKMGPSKVLDKWEDEGKVFSRTELGRLVRLLRRVRKHKRALEVYEWMNERRERFSLSSSDSAIQLDLISKAYGISRAKEFFSRLPESLKDHRTYGALLTAYVEAKMKKDAESLMNKIKEKGYAIHPLPYNMMMTLYMKFKEFDKVISLVSEMTEKNLELDIFSYNIWLTTCRAMGSIELMESVLERMKLDSRINPTWKTYSTMATMYINLGQVKKAKASLKMIEARVTSQNQVPYNYLLSLYGGLGEKEEIYRIWSTYRASFPNIPNFGYRTVIASLLRLDDIRGAEKCYSEWMSETLSYDPRISNLIIRWYVRNRKGLKAKEFLDHVIEMGGKANAYSWELLAEGHIRERRIDDALFCMKKAYSTDHSNKWRPDPTNVSRFLSLCEKESNMASKEAFMDLLRKVRCFNTEAYMSLIISNGGAEFRIKLYSNETGIQD